MPRVRRTSSRSWELWLAAFVLAGSPAAAQTPGPSAAPEAPEAAAQSPETPAPPPAVPPIDVTGFVDIYYGYNLNKVDPPLRAFDVQHNTFSLNMAEVALAKGVTPDSRVGFRADFDFGKGANVVAAFEPDDTGKDIAKFIQQGYLSVLAGEKLQLDFGKFVTPHGAEVIESQDNWNYTRSLLFNLAIPFYHLGVRATLPVNDKVTLSGYVVNGWNNISEVNGAKTFGLGAILKPTDKITWAGTFMAGEEVADGDTRALFDTTLTLGLTPKFTVMANFDYGKEGDVKWWGLASYAKLQASNKWALVGRYEYLDDTDGGFMTLNTKAQSLTITSDHLVAGGLKARLEYRTDFTDDEFFIDSDSSSKKSQTTLTVGLVYGFGGKI
jgi:hypothetical protein